MLLHIIAYHFCGFWDTLSISSDPRMRSPELACLFGMV